MKNSSLCYLERGGKYLMLHRTKKKNDANGGKWIGVGGAFEEDESPDECAKREIFEETGLTVRRLEYRGIVTFVSDVWETEYMHIFTSNDFSGEITECNEGKLEWIDKNELLNLNIWEGDKIFLKLISSPFTPFFSLRLEYIGDKLISAILDNKTII